MTITYADHLDLEESLVPKSPSKIETNKVAIKKKNGFKSAFSPMEPIEECSMEMSSGKKDEESSR